jgi:hypothetical protein
MYSPQPALLHAGLSRGEKKSHFLPEEYVCMYVCTYIHIWFCDKQSHLRNNTPRLKSWAPFGNAPVSVPVSGEQINRASVWSKRHCERLYCTANPELRDCPQPLTTSEVTSSKDVFFLQQRCFHHRPSPHHHRHRHRPVITPKSRCLQN